MEIVTDAHVQIAALMSMFNNRECIISKNTCMNCRETSQIHFYYSLDVWHKACKLSSKLTAVSAVVVSSF